MKPCIISFLLPALALAAAPVCKPRLKNVLFTGKLKNPYRQLTPAEAVAVEQAFLKNKTLALTKAADASVSDNYIWLIEALNPSKAEAQVRFI